MFLVEIALAANLLFAQEPFKYTKSDETDSVTTLTPGVPMDSGKPPRVVLTVKENKITWNTYCKMVEKETQDKLGSDFVVAYRPTQKPKFPVKLGGRFDLENSVFVIDILVDDSPGEEKKK